MDENIQQIFDHLDLDEPYEEEISLKRLIGNNNARAIVTTYLDFYQNELADGKKPELKPILLIYEKGSGVHVFAKAISNSFGNLNCCTISGSWLSDKVIGFNQFFWAGSDFDSYYIHGDKFSSYCQQQLHSALTTKKLPYYDFAENKWTRKEFSNKLIMLSVEKTDSLSSLLLKEFSIKINLVKLTIDEIELALRQRVSLLGWNVNSPYLIGQIAQSSSDVGQAMDVLVMSHRISKNQNKELITEVDFNMALHLLSNCTKATNQKMG